MFPKFLLIRYTRTSKTVSCCLKIWYIVIVVRKTPTNSMSFSYLIRKNFHSMTRQTVRIRMLLCLFTFCNFVDRKTNLILKILLKYSVFHYEFLNRQKTSSVLLCKEGVKSQSTFQTAFEWRLSKTWIQLRRHIQETDTYMKWTKSCLWRSFYHVKSISLGKLSLLSIKKFLFRNWSQNWFWFSGEEANPLRVKKNRITFLPASTLWRLPR